MFAIGITLDDYLGHWWLADQDGFPLAELCCFRIAPEKIGIQYVNGTNAVEKYLINSSEIQTTDGFIKGIYYDEMVVWEHKCGSRMWIRPG